MGIHVSIHYDNSGGFSDPYLWVWYAGAAAADDFKATGTDGFGTVFDVDVKRSDFSFKFKNGPGTSSAWEGPGLDRRFRPLKGLPETQVMTEIWCRGGKAFIYPTLPAAPEAGSAANFLKSLTPAKGIYLPDSGALSGLGATPLAGGGVLFGLYHPNAGRVFVFGSFNDWQRPGHNAPLPDKFCELKLYRGYFGIPNTWLLVLPQAKPGDEYKFCVQGGVPSDDKGRFQRYFTDPYARELGPDYGMNNSKVVDAGTFAWTDQNWHTPNRSKLILYEMSVYGFTEGDNGIVNPGKFAGITERIDQGYFNDLGVTALALMPLAEYPGPQGSRVLGYSTSLFCAVERDFGSCDDLRQLVDSAHGKGLAVILDEVFNHTSNDFNPLYKMILEHPDEEFNPEEGGLYYSGKTRWGNRVATEKEDVQNLLIDACKLMLVEYHVDGFRFDATHTDWMDHGFVLRLARELTSFCPSVVLIAENLPNQQDLNRSGYDGFSQWSDPFHDKMKALLREGVFDNSNFYNADKLADIFYFSKSLYAAHTDNAVNYVESHDESSVSYEVKTNPALDQPATKERKARLGLFCTMTALGIPMLYMGGEFNVERDRNIVSFDWPKDGPGSNGFFRWASRLIRLRRRYPALQIEGYSPAETGQFAWILGPWMDGRHGGGSLVLGWRLWPTKFAHDAMVVLLNFENRTVSVDLELGARGTWLKLADADNANDIAPEGSNSVSDAAAIKSYDGRFGNFDLPSSSCFLYKWESDQA